MEAAGVRKVVTVVEDVHVEGSRAVAPPTRIVAAGAVVANPLAGRFVEDLSPLVDAYCEPLGQLLTARALELLGAEAQGFGKGALVGLDGDVEHGSAVIHNLRFGNHVRGAVRGSALLPAAEKRGAAGATLDLAVTSTTRPCARTTRHSRCESRTLPARTRSSSGSCSRRAAVRMRGSERSAANSRPERMRRAAVIGVGTMGLPLARRLVAAGYEVTACDADAARAWRLGAAVAETPAEAAERADVIITSLPSPETVEEVVLGAAGVASTAPPGTLLLEMSTSPPSLARRLAKALAGKLEVLDAPVSGGPRGAEDGTLTIMVGGRPETFARAEPLLRKLGRQVVHVGAHGAGQAAKLCNNLVAGATMAALAEACAVAVREDIDAHTLYALLTASTGDSRVLRTRFPLAGVDVAHPASRSFAPLFAVDLIAKDLELALDLAAARNVRAPVATAALDAYRETQRSGRGALDYSAVYLDVADRAGTD